MVSSCKDKGIRIIPQINHPGLKSWHSNPSKLIEVYPEFDKKPGIQLLEKHPWSNIDTVDQKPSIGQNPDQKLHLAYVFSH